MTRSPLSISGFTCSSTPFNLAITNLIRASTSAGPEFSKIISSNPQSGEIAINPPSVVIAIRGAVMVQQAWFLLGDSIMKALAKFLLNFLER
jgi:hypothetical protein